MSTTKGTHMTTLTLSRVALGDHIDRLYSSDDITRTTLQHNDGAGFGTITILKETKRALTISADDAAVKELLADFDYYIDAQEGGALDQGCAGLVRSMKAAAAKIRTTLSKVGA